MNINKIYNKYEVESKITKPGLNLNAQYSMYVCRSVGALTSKRNKIPMGHQIELNFCAKKECAK